MIGRSLGYTIAAILGLVLICVGGLIVISGAALACTPNTPTDTATTDTTATAGTGSAGGSSATDITTDPVPGYDAEQITNAEIITSVGVGRGIPTFGEIVAVAVAIQESGLRNLPGGDRDSVGLFQQRPSQGWGTPAQLQDPVYAANKFYDKLLTVPDWQQLPLTFAAQAVQHSAHPGAYAQWETDATALVAGTGALGGGCTGGDGMTDDGVGLPTDFTLPADTPAPIITAIWWALQQLGTPYHYGGDCTDPHSGNPTKQCDCSSLTQQSYAHAGITIPRTTDGQQHAGTAVDDPAQLRPGDLIFIPGADGTRADPGHVGLYLGQGFLVQAPHTGDVVKITSLSAWALRIATIRRIIP